MADASCDAPSASDDPQEQTQPCRACGRMTCNFCEGSPIIQSGMVIGFADRCPRWPGKRTPLCSQCKEEMESTRVGVLCAADDSQQLTRPCVDCGRITCNFCDGIPTKKSGIIGFADCFAADRCPREQWASGQRTPLCSQCEEKNAMCHFCRGNHWCTPPKK